VDVQVPETLNTSIVTVRSSSFPLEKVPDSPHSIEVTSWAVVELVVWSGPVHFWLEPSPAR
jgi:hypothetical protein